MAEGAPGRLLVVDFVGLGSACLAVPVLRALEEAHPAIHYAYPENALLTDPELRRASGLRGLLGLTPPRWRRFDNADWTEMAEFVREHAIDTVMNFRNPDLTIDPRYAEFQAWCGKNGLWLRWHDLYRLDGVASMHVQERMEAVLAAAGLSVAPLRREWLRGLDPTDRTGREVGLFSSASAVTKRWPLDRWLALARELADDDMTLVVLGGSSGNERDQALELAERLGDIVPVQCISFAPAKGIRELVARLRALSVLVANDTGVGHIAAACGTPVVSLFLSTSSRVWRPRSAAAVAMQSAVGARCPNQRPLQGNCTRHYDTCDAPCHLDLPANVVAKAVREAILAS